CEGGGRERVRPGRGELVVVGVVGSRAGLVGSSARLTAPCAAPVGAPAVGRADPAARRHLDLRGVGRRVDDGAGVLGGGADLSGGDAVREQRGHQGRERGGLLLVRGRVRGRGGEVVGRRAGLLGRLRGSGSRALGGIAGRRRGRLLVAVVLCGTVRGTLRAGGALLLRAGAAGVVGAPGAVGAAISVGAVRPVAVGAAGAPGTIGRAGTGGTPGRAVTVGSLVLTAGGVVAPRAVVGTGIALIITSAVVRAVAD